MRLDKYLAEYRFSSRTKAARAIAEGRVFVNGRQGKASEDVSDKDTIDIRENPLSFVSEGGYKLQKAFDDFGGSVRGLVCVDLGASTGGFTDCLLQAGVGQVYAVDVGKDQLDEALRADTRVHVLDEMNVRYLQRADIPAGRIEAIAADLSFISLKLILPVIGRLLDAGGVAYILVKPQFECGGIGLNKHGILKDEKKRREIVFEIADSAARLGLQPIDITEAPIREGKNVEYVLQVRKTGFPAELEERFINKVTELK